MPLLLTKGLGAAAETMTAATAVASATTLTIFFSATPVLTGASALPGSWSVTANGPGPVAVSVSAVTVADDTVVLTLSKQTQGGRYRVLIPDQGILSDTGLILVPPYYLNFSGSALAPTVLSLRIVSATAMALIFDQDMIEAEARDPANYSIGPSLSIYSVTGNGRSYQLQTQRQDILGRYSLTVSGIHDLFGNLV